MLTRGLDRPFAPAGTQCRACRRRALVTQAIFKRKGPPAPKEEKAPAKRCAAWSLTWCMWVASCRGCRDIQSAHVHGHSVPGRGKQSPLSQVIDALDFAEVRSERDADLLYQAKGRKKGQKMSAEEAA
jgi:hypothetical protein